MKQDATVPRRGGPVFYDPSHRRGRWLSFAAVLATLALAAWAGSLFLGLVVLDTLGRDAGLARPQPAPPAVCTGEPVDPALHDPAVPGLAAAAYLEDWPPGGPPAMAATCGFLAALYPEWYEVDVETGRLAPSQPDGLLRLRLDALRDSAGPGLRVRAVARLPLPLLPLGPGLADPALRGSIVAGAVAALDAGGYSGFCLRPTGLRPRHAAGLASLMAELDAALALHGAESCLIAAATEDSWRDPAIAGPVDRVVLMAFDLGPVPQAGSASGPGPGPGPALSDGALAALLAEATARISPDRLSVALASLATDGSGNRPLAYAEAMALARLGGGEVLFDPVAGSGRIRFPARTPPAAPRDLWLLDAPTVWNQLRLVASAGIGEAVVWSLGLEDPGVWPVLAGSAAGATGLGEIDLSERFAILGAGPFLRLLDRPQTGTRRFFTDTGDGPITGQAYDSLPLPHVFERHGGRRAGEDGPRRVALTFDDGPDPRVTPRILDILRDRAAPAAFFLVGSGVIRNPDLARRILAEGHEFGSHSFFHPDGTSVSPLRLDFELDATQRLLAAVTGHATRLFRLPYGDGVGPSDAASARLLADILDRGYLVTGADSVPQDWAGLAADEIVERVRADLAATTGDAVVVLHDAGGDRSATVAALPVLIDALRADGFEIAPLAALAGTGRDALMPPRDGLLTRLDALAFTVFGWAGHGLATLFWIAVALGTARAAAVLILAHLRRPHRLVAPPAIGASAAPAPAPQVTVLIPAFNERPVILRAVRAVLASTHADLRVIVIDDGSTDGTGAVVAEAFADDPRVRLLSQANGGKWRALLAGYDRAETDVVVALDADSMLRPDAISLLARHFDDPTIGAVAGMVRVGNRRGLLGSLQDLEYTLAQNVERRAAERIGAMLVVPGAIGAWRRGAVEAAGLPSGDTLTEDADLTVAVLRAGYRVVFEPAAVSVTEVPDRLGAFLRQRLRWTFGMMQTAWKHRGAARAGHPVGLVAIPDLWITGVLLGLAAPVVDLVMLGAVAELVTLRLSTGAWPPATEPSWTVLAGWLALPLLDLVTVLAALRLDPDARRRLLLVLPLQRLVYRPLLYLTVYRAVLRALAGQVVAWGKTARSGRLADAGG